MVYIHIYVHKRIYTHIFSSIKAAYLIALQISSNMSWSKSLFPFTPFRFFLNCCLKKKKKKNSAQCCFWEKSVSTFQHRGLLQTHRPMAFSALLTEHPTHNFKNLLWKHTCYVLLNMLQLQSQENRDQSQGPLVNKHNHPVLTDSLKARVYASTRQGLTIANTHAAKSSSMLCFMNKIILNVRSMEIGSDLHTVMLGIVLPFQK